MDDEYQIDIKCRYKPSMLFKYGCWVGFPVQFQYDMTIDGATSERKAIQEFKKKALEYLKSSESAQQEYLKWLLKIQ